MDATSLDDTLPATESQLTEAQGNMSCSASAKEPVQAAPFRWPQNLDVSPADDSQMSFR